METKCPGSVPATAQYNANNQITWTSVNGAANGLTYDAAGNVLNDNSNAYLYDAEGRLCAVKNATGIVTAYVYDAEGRRVAKGSLSSWPSACVAPTSSTFTLNTSYILGPGGEQVSELSVSGSTATWVHTNIFAGGKLLATYHDNNTYLALNDWLGTKRAEYTPNGLSSTFFSLPYGNGLTTNGSASDATEHHFTGKERDSESSLDMFGARYYGSSFGRFTTPDWSPTPAAVPYAQYDDPQSLNLYSYASNRPLVRTDPNGHCVEPLTTLFCLAVGIGVAKAVIGMWEDKTNTQMLMALRENYEAAKAYAVKVCSSGGGDCDAAIETAKNAYLNLLKAAKKTAKGFLGFPGTFMGGDLPSSMDDFATGEIQDMIQAEVEREIEAKQTEEEQKRKQQEQQGGEPCKGLCPDTPPQSPPDETPPQSKADRRVQCDPVHTIDSCQN